MPPKRSTPHRGNGRRPSGGGGRRRSSGPHRPPIQSDEPEDKEKAIEIDGVVTAVLAGTMFRVKLRPNDHQVLAHISGKMRKRFIRLVIGDGVRLEMSPYDPDKARIVYRL